MTRRDIKKAEKIAKIAKIAAGVIAGVAVTAIIVKCIYDVHRENNRVVDQSDLDDYFEFVKFVGKSFPQIQSILEKGIKNGSIVKDIQKELNEIILEV